LPKTPWSCSPPTTAPNHYAYPRIRYLNHRSSGPLRGLKRDLYEGGHRVPFLVKWPGVIKPGVVSPALTSQVDLFATLAAAAGATVPPNCAHDSYDMLPVWKDNAPSPRHSIVHNTNPNAYAYAYALRHHHWLLINTKSGARTPVPEWFNTANGYQPHDQPGELYNLDSDLAQQHNLYEHMPERVAELSEILKQLRARGQLR